MNTWIRNELWIQNKSLYIVSEAQCTRFMGSGGMLHQNSFENVCPEVRYWAELGCKEEKEIEKKHS